MNRLFPILVPRDVLERMGVGGLADQTTMVVCAVPWALMERHELQVRRNHRMGIESLASRGGLDACEAVAAIERTGEELDWSTANARLAEHAAAWRGYRRREVA